MHEDTDVGKTRHDFGRGFAWGEPGEPMGISKRDKISALRSPPPAPRPAKPRKRPAFAARLQRSCGDLGLSGDVVVSDRECRPD